MTPVVLGGAVSTELQRRGCSIAAPWWSNMALRTPEGRVLLRRVHADFLAAGAHVLAANTFRTNKYALAEIGTDCDDLIRIALDEARGAREDELRAGVPRTNPQPRIAASIAPVRDSYAPELVPDDDVLAAEHRWHVERLVEHGAELLLVETMNTGREALAALAEGKRLDQTVWVSFVCDDGGRLLSGEPVAQVAGTAVAQGADAVLVNCTNVPATSTALAMIRDGEITGPVGCYPNIESRAGLPKWERIDRYIPSNYDPHDFAGMLAALAETYGLAIVGGCCGTSPGHLAAAAKAVSRDPAAGAG